MITKSDLDKCKEDAEVDELFIELLKERDEALAEKEHIIEIIKSEEELPGDMPEEIWEFVISSRLNCANSHRMVVKRTKQNIIQKIMAGRGGEK